MTHTLQRLLLTLVSVGLISGCSLFDASKKQPRPMSRTAPKHAPYEVDLSAYKPIQSATDRPWQRDDLAFAIAISGGGYRAANLGAGVLMELEKFTHPKLKGRLLDEVDYFSTVSGGGYVTGYYLHMLKDFFNENPTANLKDFSFSEKFLNEVVAKRVEHDTQKGKPKPQTTQDHYQMLAPSTNPVDKYTLALIETLKQPLYFNRAPENLANLSVSYSELLTRDVIRSLFVAKIFRGENFEKALEDNLFNYQHSGETFTLGDVFVAKDSNKAVKLPFWVTNATILQNGAIFPYAPNVLKSYKIIRYRYRGETQQLAGRFSDPEYAYEFPYINAVRASSNVPIVFPPTVLISSDCDMLCYMQLLDGGLSDNLGVTTAVEILRQEKTPYKILMVIDAYNEPTSPYTSEGAQLGAMDTVIQLGDINADARRNRVRYSLLPEIRQLLCNSSEKVLIVYLDLDGVPDADKVPTELSVTVDVQQKILEIAKQVFHGDEITRFLEKEQAYRCPH